MFNNRAIAPAQALIIRQAARRLRAIAGDDAAFQMSADSVITSLTDRSLAALARFVADHNHG